MTSTDFQSRFPKPWSFVITKVGFSLRAANGAAIGYLNLHAYHAGIPQKEWNRHVAAGVGEYLRCEGEK